MALQHVPKGKSDISSLNNEARKRSELKAISEIKSHVI